MNSEDLLLLLCEDETWENLVSEAAFSREEAKAAREGLRNQAILRLMEIKAKLQQEQDYEGSFWKVFPEVKMKLRQQIVQLRELADRADRVHKACTISNMVANSTGLMSSIMNVVGIGLVPVTGGLSLGLPVCALSLGAVSVAITGTTSLVEHSKMSSIEAEAKSIASPRIKPGELVQRVVTDSTKRFSSAGNSFKMLRRAVKHVRATDVPNLATKNSILNNRLVQKVLGDSTKKMTKKALIMSGVGTSAFVVWDAYSLIQDLNELQTGAKTQSAEKMRQRANELEKMLEELNKFHESRSRA